VIEHIDLAVIQAGKLVIYRDGERVAEFDPDMFPALILKMAQELKHASR
jgi:hypothetical protein